MKPFLEQVASDLLAKHGSCLSDLTVVFPNKRASLFLNAHLARICGDRPVWSPRYTTISELFRRQSKRTVADPIKLVCELHRSFSALTGIDETLDHFYGWGQLLLSDFDDIDKSMADAGRVLANLRDLHEMDSTDYLSERQKEAIRRFFSSFSSDHNSLLRERFLRLWSHMADIYHDFNDRLARQGLAYEGALYREVVEELGVRSEELGVGSQYVFVGFNVLLPVEHRLFSVLRREGKARFYWDFDDYYINSEAGQFIAKNLADFPNELDVKDKDIYGSFACEKTITVASAPTENVQARYVDQWLTSHLPPLTSHPSPLTSHSSADTAIVLCDERLLPTVIHCLPDGVDHVNVTTGYPLGQTPVAALIAALFALRTQGYQPGRGRYRLRQVNAVLRHPYISGLSPQMEELHRELNDQKIYYPTPARLCTGDTTALLFRDLGSGGQDAALLEWMCDVVKAVAIGGGGRVCPPEASQQPESVSAFSIQRESLFRAYTLLNRLLALVTAGDLRVDVITLQRLMTQLMQTTTIPFHGEPVEGIQVMGLLETRNLDFRHVLLLSANEGNIPRGVSDTSFIPYILRKAYGLTTADHKVAIYSYYFFRLLQRAEDITIAYNSSTTEGHSGEMSRFVLQLMVEDRHHCISLKSLQASQAFIPFRPQPVDKTPEAMEKLRSHFGAPSAVLTPTAINRYLRCPLMFYYTYLHNLREPDTTDDDTIDNRLFGNIFHEAARIIYSRLMEKSHQILVPDIDRLLNQRVDVEMAVDAAIRQELFRLDTGGSGGAPKPMPELSGLQIINREVIIHYLRRLLAIDRRLAPFSIIGLETDVAMPFTVGDGSGTPAFTTVIGGRIDRLDSIVKDGREQIRVIDYKTGSRVPTPLGGVEAIFDQSQLKNHSDYYLQTFLYGIIVQQTMNQERGIISSAPSVAPALLFIQHTAADDYSPVLKFGKEYINDVAPHAQTFMEHLTALVDEIFSPDTPFLPTQDRSRCINCPYRLLCH